MKSKEKIILVGGGGHCCSCIDVIEQQNIYEIAAIVDLPNKIGQNILSYPILYNDGDLPKLVKEYKYFLVTVGHIESVALRLKLFQVLKSLNVVLPVIISPLAYVSHNAFINEGTIIMHNALVNAGARIGKNCIVNTKALIEHNAIVDDHCHISTGAILNGDVKIGTQSFVGSNSTIVQGCTVPPKSFIKAGSLAK